jgi:hypothetical protein
MKKIFGILSLIAIMTVVFATEASASNDNSNVEFVMDMGSPDFTPSVAIVPTVDGSLFKPIFDEPSNFVTNTSADANEVATIELIDSLSNFEYGLVAYHGSLERNLTTGLDEPLPDLTNFVNRYNKQFGSTSLIDDIATNVGKFTNPTLHF